MNYSVTLKAPDGTESVIDCPFPAYSHGDIGG